MKNDTKKKCQQQFSNFYCCKTNRVCGEAPYAAKGVKMCSKCHNILRSICSKVTCRDENGKKPNMVKPACENGEILNEVAKVDSEGDERDDMEVMDEKGYDRE